jgi:cell division protein FtsL
MVMSEHRNTEYHTVKRIDNSRLARPTHPARLRDFWKRLAIGGALAGCSLFYAWQHFESIQQRYELEHLNSERMKAAELNQQLQLEVATLRSPARVDSIARNQLGLTVPVPAQMAPAEGATDGVLAEARPVAFVSRP